MGPGKTAYNQVLSLKEWSKSFHIVGLGQGVASLGLVPPKAACLVECFALSPTSLLVLLKPMTKIVNE